MAVLRKTTSIVTPLTMVVILGMVTVMVTEVSSVRYVVGGNQGWSPTVNYTIWAQEKNFYTNDLLFFVYDKKQIDVMEVSETNYESCNAEYPLHNYTTGTGRDVVALDHAGIYYFISTKGGACYGDMRLALLVHQGSSPVKDDAPASIYYRGHIIIPTLIAISFIWDSWVRIW